MRAVGFLMESTDVQQTTSDLLPLLSCSGSKIKFGMDLMAYIPSYGMKLESAPLPVLEHICEAPRRRSELKGIIKGKTFSARLHRWLQRIRLISRSHPFTQWCLKSTTAVNYEINRHLKTYPHMIHPFSSFRIFWESVITIYTIVALLITPYYLSFYFTSTRRWNILISVVDSMFICDVIIMFFTGYYDDRTKIIVLDPKIVASQYLKTYFIIDIAPVIPLDAFVEVAPESFWYLACLDMLKVIRMRIVAIYWNRLRYVYKVGFQLNKVLEITVVVIMCVHWAACLEYFIPLMFTEIVDSEEDSWIYSASMRKKDTTLTKYLLCLNRATTALVRSQHYLDMKTPEDIVLNLIFTIVGFLGFIYLLAQMSQLMTSFHSTSKRQLMMEQQLRDYIRHKELPPVLQKRLLVYSNYRYKKGFDRNRRILNQVSPYLREELMLHNYLRVVSGVELFQHIPQPLMVDITAALQPEIYMTGDVVVRAGTRGEALYFIGCGTAAVYTSGGKEICHLEDGAYFGEISLVMENEFRIANIIAAETSEIYVLTRTDFQRIIGSTPGLLCRLQTVVVEQLDRTLLLEDAYNLEGTMSPIHINISTLKNKRRQ